MLLFLAAISRLSAAFFLTIQFFFFRFKGTENTVVICYMLDKETGRLSWLAARRELADSCSATGGGDDDDPPPEPEPVKERSCDTLREEEITDDRAHIHAPFYMGIFFIKYLLQNHTILEPQFSRLFVLFKVNILYR